MPIRKGQAGIVSDTANDQVIADQQGVFHGSRGNDAGLPNRSVDQQEDETNPEPRENFAADARAYRGRGWGCGGFCFNFQFAPS